VPFSEEAQRLDLAKIAEEVHQRLLDLPGAGRLELAGADVLGPGLLGAGLQKRFAKPVVTGSLEAIVPLGGQFLALLVTNLIDCLAGQVGDVELVEHDGRFGKIALRGRHVGLMPVHGDGLDRVALLLDHGGVTLAQGLAGAAVRDVQDGAAVEIANDGDEFASPKRLLVDPQNGRRLGGPASQAAIDGPLHDAVGLSPGEAELPSGRGTTRVCNSFSVWTNPGRSTFRRMICRPPPGKNSIGRSASLLGQDATASKAGTGQGTDRA
jgi:hypothetical protein